MRNFIAVSIIAGLALGTGCATSGANRPINVAAVRHDINDTIQSTNADRSVTSMGKVSAERAVVYTTAKSGQRQEEVWVKSNGTWTLETAVALKQ